MKSALNKSTTSKVYIANFQETSEIQTLSDRKYAVKVSLFPYSKIDTILKEIELLQTLDHKNIIKPILWEDIARETSKSVSEIRIGPENAFMITDFEERGDLHMALMSEGRFAESEACHYFKQTLSALKYLHDRDIVHRDIKLPNVLLSDDEQVKLIDFGHSCHLYPKGLSNHDGEVEISNIGDIKGTQGYVSPEMLDARTKIMDYLESGGRSDWDRPKIRINLKQADIFSLGVLLFEMVIGIPPFVNANCRDSCYRSFYFKRKEARFWRVHSQAKGLDEQRLISEEFKNLIQRMLTPFPKERISIEEIEEHPWLKI